MSSEESNSGKTGPDPETIRIEGEAPDWKDALKHAMSKTKPEDWPKKNPNQKDQQG